MRQLPYAGAKTRIGRVESPSVEEAQGLFGLFQDFRARPTVVGILEKPSSVLCGALAVAVPAQSEENVVSYVSSSSFSSSTCGSHNTDIVKLA